MFDFFKKETTDRPQDVKALRESFLRFIKEQLQKVEGGEGRNIKSIHLYVACNDDEKHLYESALYIEAEATFKNEIQRIGDDFAIALPENWILDILFVQTLPPEALHIPSTNAGLFIQTKKTFIQKDATAYVRALCGETEKKEYIITSTTGRVNIGREKKVQADDGFFRINNIAFPDSSADDCNKFVSRQHAHIEYNAELGNFVLYADEGGIPPRNKVKVRSTNSSDIAKVHTTQIGHVLQDGDQIMLGDSAILEFSFTSEEA